MSKSSSVDRSRELLSNLDINTETQNEDSVALNLNIFKKKYEVLKNTNLFKKRYTDIKEIEFANDELDFFNQIIQNSLTSPMEYNFVYKELTLPIVSYWISKKSTDLVDIVERLGALAMIIDFNRDIASLVEHFVKANLHYLEAVILTNDKKDIELLLLAFYRLIKFDKIKFLPFIKAGLMTTIISGAEYSLISKFLGTKIFAYLAEMSENKEIEHLSMLKEQDPSGFIGKCDNIDNFDYNFLDLNEANRLSWYFNLELQSYDEQDDDLYLSFPPALLTENVEMVYGKFVLQLEYTNSATFYEQENKNLIANSQSLKPQIQAIIENLNSNKPTLISGPSGSGKTHIIQSLHKRLSKDPSSIISIHLGEQTDAKLLLGTYTSGSKPGTFEWKNGVLTTAIKEGKWVVVEDINKAPTEVLSVLLSLLENRCITIPSRGETIYCANGFQMVATITTSKDNSNNYRDLIGFRLWNEIEIPEIPDLMELLKWKSDEQLYSLLPNLVAVFEEVRKITALPSFSSLNKGVASRPVTVRDLVKLCDRLTILVENKTIDLKWMTSESYDIIFLETLACFTSFVCEQNALALLADHIGSILQIQPQRIKVLTSSNYIPSLVNDESSITLGRCQLEKSVINKQKKSINDTSFATTNHAKRLMEKVAVSIKNNEPVLLVGETGTGKTTVVQQISKMLHKKLTVINVSQQTEASDLLGGYKPVNCRTLIVPIIEEFEELFPITFSMSKNEKFYNLFHKCVKKQHWSNVIKVLNQAYQMAETVCNESLTEAGMEEGEDKALKKRKFNCIQASTLLQQWMKFKKSYEIFEIQSQSLEKSFVFDFVEGSLVKAIKNGEWLLLDELNLATADTLENIADLLNDDPESRSILLSEKGEAEAIKVHPDFRLFGCMNPATDVGKRDLPLSIRSRFTEIYVESPDSNLEDLLAIIDRYIGRFAMSDEWVGNDIASLYIDAKKLAEANRIVDGSSQRPHFSIRTLTRTLLYVIDIISIYGLRRSLYEGFCMSYLTLLDLKSENILKPIIEKYTIGKLKNSSAVINTIPKAPTDTSDAYIQFKHYWLKKGNFSIRDVSHYIITPFVEKNMLNLVRASSSGRFPILVQGPTSSGKTSMIKYLADLTGHKMVRINNHEHTDLQEYLGTYVTDDTGKLTFREGILVEALKNGYWIVLDELNLAPTDVLEALNRLLDDNRELLIPETQEIIHPHPDFMLFATQNPPGLYGGRKVLSRAFRNRFLELHFDDIPENELEIIIKERCQIAPSYAKKIVDVYRELLVQRSANRLFETKNSFATLRDLFRWANREAVGYDQLACNGYMLLAERCRTPAEKALVKKVIEKIMRVKLDMDAIYGSLENSTLMSKPSHVVWTRTAKRLSVLVAECLKNNEPVLLVGETGCGKTTIVQLLAEFLNKELVGMNAHQNTETGDILGAQRPVRNRSNIQEQLLSELNSLFNESSNDLEDLLKRYELANKLEFSETSVAKVDDLIKKSKTLFEWTDGPLIQALKTGDFFLLDEISLADDSVLERLNSVLEPERSLLLAEKGSGDMQITAADGFQFFATMNPGGDYGKKELSPALRNRFTEIWVPSMEDFKDVAMIVESKLIKKDSSLVQAIVEFSEWFALRYGNGNASSGVISLRDILAWVDFVNATLDSLNNNNIKSLIQGAAMVFIDALGTNNTAYLAANIERLEVEKKMCFEKIFGLMNSPYDSNILTDSVIVKTDTSLTCGAFSIPIDPANVTKDTFNLSAPTTSLNLMKVIRALQVNKPILLEGSPGVGKTSLIQALADATGNNLTRINLSEQTDLIDLFGSDTPGETTGEFVWRDAPFLRAMQKGEWVLLDEMNLASQSVLEGLNACLDHRGEAYIPELDKSFAKSEGFMVFAAQNPQYQGGGRKGLPKSFVNRFSVVYADSLSSSDLNIIARHLYPNIDPETINKMIQLMSLLDEEVCQKKSFASLGSPWEFNLRDTLRWLSLLDSGSEIGPLTAEDLLNMIVSQRFRSPQDKEKVNVLIESIFGQFPKKDNFFAINKDYVEFNSELVSRFDVNQYRFDLVKSKPLQCNFEIYESFLKCVKYNWPLILTGPSSSGKTELIKLMSGLIGNKVLEFSMNSDVDSMDILGGYEQVDVTRKLSYVLAKLKGLLLERLSVDFYNADLCALLDFINENSIDSVSKFENFVNVFNKCLSSFSSEQSLALNEIKEEILKFFNLLKVGFNSSVKFEWFDGMLVKAVEQGNWLILDNANLCSPSVLDRLNSLLETNGSLIINECSLEDGRPRVVKPHPNFRLFLTCNPKYGELSRAMRNRGVEIFMSELNDRATEVDLELIRGTSNNLVYGNVNLANTKDSNWAKLQDLMNKSVANDAFGLNVLKFDQLSDTSAWANNLIDNPYNDLHDDDELFKVIYSAKEIIPSSLFDDKSISSNVLNLQHLNKFINNYLGKDDGAEFAMFIKGFSVFVNISSMLDSVTKLGSSGFSKQQLSFLEQSAMAYFNMDINLKMKNSFPIYDILISLNDFVKKLYSSTNDISTISNNTNVLLIKLVLLWSSMFSTSNSSNKNETKLRVYQEMINDWLNTVDESVVEREYLFALRDKFVDTVRLSRGLQVTSIWKTFRKEYPTSEQSWSDYFKLLKLSKSLDDLAVEQFEETYEFINSLRSLIHLLMNDLNKNIKLDDSIFETLNNGLIKLNDISSKFLIKRSHFFRSEFQQIYQILLLAKSKEDTEATEMLLKVATNALIPTHLQSLIKDDDTFLVHLWQFDNATGALESNVDDVISSELFNNAINKSIKITSSKGFEVDQTLSDCKILLKTIIENSSNLLQDSKQNLKTKLYCWSEQIIACLNLNEKTSFTAEIINKYFKPILDVKDIKEIEWSSLGKLFLSFGLGSILLFCPDKSYDPAAKDYCENEQYKKLCEFYDSIASEWALIRNVYFHDSDLLNIETSLPTSDSLDSPSKPIVYRDDTNNNTDLLFDEWNSFVETTVSEESITALMASFDSNDNNLNKKVEIFQNNTSQFIKRMQVSYTKFSDLNDILVKFIYSLKLGFDILKFDNLESKKTYKLTTTWTNKLNNILLEDKFKSNLLHFNVYLKNQTIENMNIEEIIITLLKVISFQGSESESNRSIYNQLLETLYYRWSLRRMKEEQLEEQNDGLYKYDYDVEKQAEEEFKKMFPDYEELMSVEDSFSVSKSSQVNAADVYYKIANTFIAAYSSQEVSRLTPADLISETSKISHRLPSDIFLKDSPDSDLLISAVFNMDKQMNAFNKPSTNTVNFYTDYSVPESKKAIEVITKLSITASQLLEKWPENATLGEICRITEEFLSYPVETPVARLLLKLEQIFTFVAEWEKYASSEVSLSTHYSNLTSLIVAWRKLELSTWNSLLDAEDLKLDANLGKWWFYLFECIVVANLTKKEDSTDANVTNLLASLNVFFNKSKIGEFANRLSIVRSFYNYCTLNQSLLPFFVTKSLANIIKYYDQFFIMIQDNIIASRKVIEKDVKDIILLASWKDINIDALKQSSKKSHNNLFKHVRKYRDVINRECQSLIEQGIQDTTIVKFVPFKETKAVTVRNVGDLTVLSEMVQSIPTFQERASSLQNVELVSRNMSKYISKVDTFNYPCILDLVSNVVEDVEYLKKETPNVYTKELKKQINSLKTNKLKLLSDTIKEFRRIGYKVSFRDDIHSYLSTVTAILTKLQPFDATEFEVCDKYVFQLLDMFPKLRSVIHSTEQQDIPVTDLNKCLAVIENLLYALLTDRDYLYDFAIGYNKLETVRTELEEFNHVEDIVVKSKHCKNSYERVVYGAKWISEYLNFAVEIAKICGKEINVRDDVARLVLFHDKFSTLSLSSASIIKTKELKYMDAYYSILNEFKSYLNSYTGGLHFLMDSLSKFIVTVTNMDDSAIKEESKSTLELHELELSFRKLYSSILLAVQKVNNLVQAPITSEDDKWAKTTSSLLQKTVKSINIKQINGSLMMIHDQLSSNDFTSSDSLLIQQLSSFTMPLVNHYYSLATIVLNKSKSHYYNTSKATYLLTKILNNLATNGLCQPQPPSEETQETGAGDSEAAGLGDGAADDVNNDNVEEDEDLLEDAATKNPDQNDDEKDDNKDDGVQMENDFAGEMENLSDQDKEDESEDDEMEDEDLDEAVDDLDDDDVNAIDEKMWDEEVKEEENENEKDAQDVPQNDQNDVDADDNSDEQNNAKDETAEGKKEEDDEQKDGDDSGTNKNKELGANEDDEDLTNEEQQDEKSQHPDDDNAEEGEDAESEDEEVGAQEDQVQNDDSANKDDFKAPEVDTMDLPDDLNLESDKEDKEEESDRDDLDMDDDDDDFVDPETNTDVKPEEIEQEESVSAAEEDDENMMEEDVEDGDNSENGDDAGEENDEDDDDVDMDGENKTDSDVDEDQELNNNKEESKAGGEDAADDEDEEAPLEGLENAHNNDAADNSDDKETKQAEGNEGEGADNEAASEKQDVGASGTTQEQQAQQDSENTDMNREKAKESMKQLGDVLKEYHNRKKEINEASSDQQDESNEINADDADEFEHLDGDTGGDNLQALGDAENEEDIRPFDEELEISDEDDQKDLDAMDVDDNDSEDNGEFEGEGNNAENQVSAAATEHQIKAEEALDNAVDSYLENNIENLDDLDQLVATIDNTPVNVYPPRDITESRELWQNAELKTNELASNLSEQLRLILEPTLATKLRGDYKTGKRLNMKRIIPYIASQFRKDKIWLRRTKPSKRTYQIMLSIDNSKSMAENPLNVELTFEAIALVTKALTQLESGGLSIMRFGETSKEVIDFNTQFSNNKGEELISEFNFKEEKTNVLNMVCESMKIFEQGKQQQSSQEELWQLQIVLSDGVCEDHDTLLRLVRRCREKKIMLVFVIIDCNNTKESIMDMSQVTYVNNKLNIKKYLDTFPFEYYVVVKNIKELPGMLSLILRQYFAQS